jgi:hypothetical protein
MILMCHRHTAHIVVLTVNLVTLVAGLGKQDKLHYYIWLINFLKQLVKNENH